MLIEKGLLQSSVFKILKKKRPSAVHTHTVGTTILQEERAHPNPRKKCRQATWRRTYANGW